MNNPSDLITSKANIPYKTAYSPHDRLTSDPLGPSMTKQSMSAECDINNIMKRYEKNKIIDHVSIYKGDYGDFILEGDYHEHLNSVIAADAAFATLPALIRRRFDNDPAAFLGFVENSDNHAEMVEMGLMTQTETAPIPDKKPKKPAPPVTEASTHEDISGAG